MHKGKGIQSCCKAFPISPSPRTTWQYIRAGRTDHAGRAEVVGPDDGGVCSLFGCQRRRPDRFRVSREWRSPDCGTIRHRPPHRHRVHVVVVKPDRCLVFGDLSGDRLLDGAFDYEGIRRATPLVVGLPLRQRVGVLDSTWILDTALSKLALGSKRSRISRIPVSFALYTIIVNEVCYRSSLALRE